MKIKLLFSLCLLTCSHVGFAQYEMIGEEFLKGVKANAYSLNINKKAIDYNEFTFLSPEDVYRVIINGDKREKVVSDISYLKKFKNTLELTIYADLDSIPDLIFELPNLKKLRIVGNKNWDWNRLFIKLSKLTKLRSLVIVDCSSLGYKIPSSICLLKQLERLEIDNSFITQFPDSFNLTNLKYLSICNSQIHKIPKNFISDSLVCLDLSNNRFNGIPKEINNFSNLSFLNFEGNKYFSSDAVILCKNSKIHDLGLVHCGIERFPIELCCLEDLNVLELYGNRISNIPEEIVCFKRLKCLFIIIYPSNDIEQLKYFKSKMPYCQFVNGPTDFNE